MHGNINKGRGIARAMKNHFEQCVAFDMRISNTNRESGPGTK